MNGAGKSSVLEAVRGLLRYWSLSWWAALQPDPDGKIEQAATRSIFSADVRRIAAPGAEVEPALTVATCDLLSPVGGQQWSLYVSPDGVVAGARGQEVPSTDWFPHLATEREWRPADDHSQTPVLCSYQALRSLPLPPSSEEESQPGEKTNSFSASEMASALVDVYAKGFEAPSTSFELLERWFRTEENREAREVRNRRDLDFRVPTLEAVRRAIATFLGSLDEGSRFTNLRIEGPENTGGVLTIDKDSVPLSVNQLSEGERGTLLMVADIARRLAIANPHREDRLQGDGIVLIDELELHLHPRWQRRILPALCETFPNLQFICATHSPLVVAGLQREAVFLLEDFRLVDHVPHTYGRDVGTLLWEIMGVPRRSADVVDQIGKVARLLDEERLGEARTELARLAALVGEDDPEVVESQALLSMLGA